MIATVFSAGIDGIEGFLVTVECETHGGLPTFSLVGLPGTAVKESWNRVQTAARSCGLPLAPAVRTVNLAPADIKKEGAVYDLPILLGMLTAQGSLPAMPKDSVCFGELSLTGGLRGVNGALAMALAARDAGKQTLFVPADNAEEASLAGDGLTIYAVTDVQEIFAHLRGEAALQPYRPQRKSPTQEFDGLDYSDVLGQESVKRALEIAAAGGHNVLLCGSPGSGKSMMAKRIRTILPPMSEEEKLDVVRIYSIIGQGSQAARSEARPMRAPHHSTFPASLAGGGKGMPMPGEVSLSHNGVLFLDELPEFRADSLEVLRQPLEDGVISIVRTSGRVRYPAQFMLVCAMNPCKCGWYGHPSGRCRCSPYEVRKYRRRISGPLLDRIDIQMDVNPVPLADLADRSPSESSAEIRKRVVGARDIQRKRFAGTAIRCNAQMGSREIRESCQLDPEGHTILSAAFERLGMTARSYDRVLRLARTIADLSGEERITAGHIAEAIQYRFREKE